MTVARFVCVFAVACGSGSQTERDDAAAEPARGDATPVTATRVTGTLGGVTFILNHAAVKRGSDSDPRHWVCVSDIPVTFSLCEQPSTPQRTMLLAPFLYDNGTPKWAFPQVWLYRVGAEPLSKDASSGTLDVITDDVETGELRLTLELQFDDAQVTSGAVLVMP